jgi:prophage regulatory protein
MQSSTYRGERFLRLPEVRQRVSVARSTIWHWVRLGRFPKPLKIGENCTVWVESEVEAWIAERIATAKGGGA